MGIYILLVIYDIVVLRLLLYLLKYMYICLEYDLYWGIYVLGETAIAYLCGPNLHTMGLSLDCYNSKTVYKAFRKINTCM